MCSVIAMLSLVGGNVAKAQSEDTRWSGTNVSDVLNGTTEFFLYNVGTGTFVAHGGEWGTQAVLLYQDFGALMRAETLNGSDLIYSGAVNATDLTAKCFGVNYPEYSTGGTWKNPGTNTLGVIFEANYNGTNLKVGNITYNYTRNWTFERVETDENASTYTYYLTENIIRTKTSDKTSETKTCYVGYGKGFDASGVDNQTLTGNAVAFTDNKANQTGNVYYQWRFVTREQAAAALRNKSANAYSGLNYNVSYLLSDPFFSRNRTMEEFNYWKTTSESSTSASDGYRYNWYGAGNNAAVTSGMKGAKTDETPWDKAIIRKPTMDSKTDGEYAFGLFEGVGNVHQTVDISVKGYYQFQIRGFYQGNEAKLYIKVGDNKVETPLVKASGFTKSTSNNPNYTELVNIGKALSANEGNQYTVTVTIEVPQDNTQIEVGVSKAKATKSSEIKVAGDDKSYYYDTDIVAIDNANLYFLGEEKPFVLDEERKDISYIKNATGTNVTVYLHRTFNLNKWNSFVMPVDMTNAQVKQAFGQNVKLAKLHGVGTLSKGASCIDFQSVDLSGESNKAIEAGQMYIINLDSKPASSVKYDNEEGTSVTKDCYLIGRRDINGANYVEPKDDDQKGSDAKGVPAVKYQGTYVSLDEGHGPQAGSYVFSNGDMYRLKNPFKIMGFRGWLTDKDGNASIKGFAINEDFDNTVTFIDGIRDNVENKSDDRIYTIGGQMVGRDIKNLPAGLYIVGGKKVLVK